MATIRYMVDDVDQALPFYEKLGFALAERPGPPVAMVRRGDLLIWLSGPGASARRPMDDGAQPGPGGWNRFVIEVDDLGAMLETLAAAGIAPRSSPVSGPGGRQALVMDPSGNPIELFEARK
jgi:catechol 2,3-dioxygenase-like lactoylglutathione lyase family enzyme